MRSQSSRPNLNLATWPFGLENGEYYSYKPGVKFNVMIFGQADAYMLIYSLWDNNLIHLQEQFMALFLNSKMEVIGYRTISMGNIACCSVDIRLLASLALHCMASNVIVAHNHPSG